MIVIRDKEYGGERPLYKLHDARLERVTIHLGESSIKESGNIEAYDCTFGADANLALEYSTVKAAIKGDIHSIKNPTSGSISVAGHIGELIIDENQKAPADCTIHEIHAE